MKSLKVLHFADQHLDDRNFDEKQACMRFVVDKASDERPDLIVSAGDMFHSREVRAESKAAQLAFETIGCLSEIAPVVILVGTPSHDGTAPMLLHHFWESARVMVSNYPEQIFLQQGYLFREYLHGDVDAVISMIPPPTKQFFNIDGNLSIEQTNKAIGEAMNAIFRGFAVTAKDYDAAHILVGHFNVAGASISPTQILIGKDIEVSRGQLEEAKTDLVCLGHIHKSQKIGDRIFYSGSTQSNTFGEIDDKGFWIHTIHKEPVPESGIVRWVNSEFILTPSRKRIWIKHDFTQSGMSSLETTMDAYRGKSEGAVVRVDLKVWKDEREKINEPMFHEFFSDASEVSVSVTGVTRETVRSVEVSRAQSLVDKVMALASTRGENLGETTIGKVEELETSDPDQLIDRWKRIFAGIEIPEKVKVAA